MRAMTKINKKGDDAYLDRLLSYFQSKFNEKIKQFVPIRKKVFYVKTRKNTYIIKGYRSNKKLKLQETFTTTLKNEGFSKTYQFVQPAKEALFFEGTHYGVIEYLEPHKTSFSYHTKENISEGLKLLEEFHKVTAAFETRYRTLIPKGDIIGKWQERSAIFINNLPVLENFINPTFLTELLDWAKWSLDGIKANSCFFEKEPFVILHGDVAHHNFLREVSGTLHLIDFDLIQIGPNVLDYLQYANRILPYLDWSFEQLAEFEPMQKFLQEKAFLYALAYPSDIFREWNRLIRENLHAQPSKTKYVMDLTMNQFFLRKEFFNHLQKMV
ncbi:aminoglycoside phosphotransferase [Bacillus sp. MUM 116]|uniref:phosphotransferase n=1 Tax=Bacillus sp. MUM 116 TaxID=1678002 RepID=UPI0008F5A2F5|nr:phosphotransferase [Bacillus sp. MUM 116]OIK17050.1 aminoglycoside phosphotransferase [Bacillus sp. MUM 116]